MTIHTYPDGSQRVGEPPFPVRSPIEQERGLPEPETAPIDDADAKKEAEKARAY